MVNTQLLIAGRWCDAHDGRTFDVLDPTTEECIGRVAYAAKIDMKAAVVGSGGWGTALALALLRNGHETVLWSHDSQKAEKMRESRENPVIILL